MLCCRRQNWTFQLLEPVKKRGNQEAVHHEWSGIRMGNNITNQSDQSSAPCFFSRRQLRYPMGSPLVKEGSNLCASCLRQPILVLLSGRALLDRMAAVDPSMRQLRKRRVRILENELRPSNQFPSHLQDLPLLNQPP